MASTDKKKVKITETSKQASVDITSETIQLPADSVDHTLVAKVPSGANCTSGVNVEVEMSPDGENWCPALRKELVTTPGSTTAEIIGNEKYVDLQKNDPVFNSYAKGGLNFDVNGNEVALGTGDRDLLDQHIAVNKSFNHSMWIKSDTLPTSTYKPVLFRHGGYDTFENSKAIELTHDTFTNEYALTSIGTTTRYGVGVSTSTYGVVGTNSTYNMPLQTVTFDRDWSMTCRLFVPANTNSSVVNGSDGINFMWQDTNGLARRFRFGLLPYAGGAWRGTLGVGYVYNGAGYGVPFWSSHFNSNWSSTRDSANDNWYLVSLAYTAGTGIQLYVIRESDGTVEVNYARSNVTADYDWTTQTSMSANNAGPYPYSSTHTSCWDTKVDQYVFYDKALSLAESQELIANNQINDPLLTSFASNIISYRRFGDGPNDVFSSSVVDVRGNAQALNTTGVFDQLSSTDSGYSSSPVVTQNLAEPQTTFTTTANRINAVNGGGNVFVDANSDAQTFYSASGNVTTGAEADIGKHLLGMFSPTQASSTSRWLYARSNGDQATWRNRGVGYGGYPFMNYPSAGNYVRYNGYLNLSAFISYSANDAALKYLSISPAGVGGSGYWYVYDGTAVNFTRRSDNTSLPVYFNDGYHCAVVYTPPADITQGIPEANVAVYINGVRIKIRTTTESGVEYVEGAAPADNFYSGDETYAANSAWGGAAYLDYGTSYRYYSNVNNHMDFQRALSESEVKKLYNKGQFLDFSNMQTSFPISLSNCVGAYDADVMFLGTNNTYVGFKDCSGFGKNVLTAPFNNSTSMTQSLFSPALEINAVPVNVFKADFSVDNSLSISGWFKTSNTATGTLFSNTGGAAATGLKVDVTNSGITASYLSSSLSTSVTGNFNDGEWHHIVMVLSPGSQLIVVDNISSGTSNHTLVTDDLRGDNGFTLLGDGQENANNPSPSTTDTSKLSASLSNWSLHSEALSTEAIAQLYSNGHVRNIKNLPSVNTNDILVWWKLSDTTTPEEDSVGSNDLQYQDGASQTLLSQQVDADGAILVEKSINGNALTLSITKNFNFTTESWVSDASGETALCLSLNGFEDQAEYFALWKCSQTLPDGVVDVCDGNWHNIALSYRGQNDLAGNDVSEGDAVRFGRGSSDNPFNFSLAVDGYPLYTEITNDIGVDYIGGLNTLITDTISSVIYNVGFNIYNRHLKYDPNNNEEQYRVHGQFGSGVHTYLTNETDPHSFRGEVDETSFHTDPWWSNADGTNIDVFGSDTSKRGNLFNQEKTYTLYGRTTALAHRGSGAKYPTGVPYPLLNPELLVTSGNISDIEGTNQFLNPVRKGDTQSWDSQTSTGGLEGWWRWGDTPGDCSITVNDVKDHNSSPAVDYRDIQAVYLTDQGSSSNVVLATNESIYLEGQEATTTAGSAGTQYNQIKLENLSSLIGTATCAVKDFVSPVLQYLRIKLTGTGTCDIGEGKLEIEVNHKKRRMK